MMKTHAPKVPNQTYQKRSWAQFPGVPQANDFHMIFPRKQSLSCCAYTKQMWSRSHFIHGVEENTEMRFQVGQGESQWRHI